MRIAFVLTSGLFFKPARLIPGDMQYREFGSQIAVQRLLSLNYNQSPTNQAARITQGPPSYSYPQCDFTKLCQNMQAESIRRHHQSKRKELSSTLPQGIVSDKDSRFVRIFWRALCGYLGTLRIFGDHQIMAQDFIGSKEDLFWTSISSTNLFTVGKSGSDVTSWRVYNWLCTPIPKTPAYYFTKRDQMRSI
ncbi:uncharacterized protein VTP21DRAFT_302 [Calcarisporiella thermophila]|uniref:uncharacterized protein n=1 Tax=Calcarisporiella thermophila TaxID=911321 RepID=UPI0037441E34